MINTSFKPKQVTRRLMSDLHERAADVIAHRFGLNEDAEQKTLEAIGEKYKITRERVRQIENAALASIRKADTFKAEQAAFDELKEIIHSLGAIVSEDELLNSISK